MLGFYTQTAVFDIRGGSAGSADVRCLNADPVTGGGYFADPGMVNILTHWNGPFTSGTSSGWRVGILNWHSATVKVTAYAVCADLP